MSQPVHVPRQDPGTSPGIERRAFVRYVRQREARVHTEAAPTRVFGVAVIRQVSLNGLQVFLISRVKEGTVLEVEPRGLYFPRKLMAHVIHAAPETNGWLHGCRLAEDLSDDELRLLLLQ